ncbi:PTS system cellobiose-specific IIB component [Enterococcus sp. PF1-24]|uniref:PTS sugar transporter subunit IIB n=1 Tax=unclassified Enterococcus TaxID=2608891 RepID=UPI0024768472|nr:MULTISPECIES: PTS sugar transporter subunit IIB [unclassified Enterococcus]MDH6365070.1 PTS system cellobiose-specific IIB component [Enterococcus sp. PFB1-1]MDH6402157.1 PTS system cellobiose-specific IIB component [Enterococcus sp. PF1-24]
MKILLACAGGMSTGMLVTKMKEVAKSQNLVAEIEAYGISELEEHVAGADVILLGPQMGFQKAEVAQKYPAIPIEVIDMFDYGMMNGEKVLQLALSKIQK